MYEFLLTSSQCGHCIEFVGDGFALSEAEMKESKRGMGPYRSKFSFETIKNLLFSGGPTFRFVNLNYSTRSRDNNPLNYFSFFTLRRPADEGVTLSEGEQSVVVVQEMFRSTPSGGVVKIKKVISEKISVKSSELECVDSNDVPLKFEDLALNNFPFETLSLKIGGWPTRIFVDDELFKLHKKNPKEPLFTRFFMYETNEKDFSVDLKTPSPLNRFNPFEIISFLIKNPEELLPPFLRITISPEEKKNENTLSPTHPHSNGGGVLSHPHSNEERTPKILPSKVEDTLQKEEKSYLIPYSFGGRGTLLT